ncbi:MAG: hypothetical protein HKO64_00205, partial [Xanthomonadales bacterium]|nr:hypothetical protein [Xanthomonadales bacterium]
MTHQVSLRKTLVTLATALISQAALAVEIPEVQPTREFFFTEVEGRKASPNRFMIEHNMRLAYPADVDSVALGQAAAAAWSEFGKMKFHGAGNGQSGVWRTVGPVHEQTADPFGWQSTSGRVTGLAIGPQCNDDKCRIFVATAGGGVWRSNKGLHLDNPGWEHLSNGLISNNIGFIGLDPNDASGNTVYVGSGEGNFNFTSIAGLGVFRSFDGGDSFEKLSTMITDLDVSPDPIDFTLTRGIEAIAVTPGSPDTIYVGTTTASQGMTSIRGGQSTATGGPQAKVGIYKTGDGGASWTLEYEAPVNTFSSAGTHEGIFEVVSGIKDIRFDPLDADTVWASVADLGLVRSAPALEGGDASFKQVFEIAGAVKTDSYAAFDLVIKDGKTRAYVYNGNGSDLGAQGLARLDDAGVPALSLYSGGNQAAWMNMTQLGAPKDFLDFVLCGVQCVYDLVVESPPGLPDTVYIAGNFSNWTGDAVVYSTDAGDNFKGFGVDVGEVPARPHVDTRSIVFSPENPDIVFIGSDGGVVRSNGNHADATAYCGVDIFSPGSFVDDICKATWDRVPEKFIFMNRGLQTMQLYNISADPNRPLKRIMAGTQDNSTQWSDGTQGLKNWTQILDIGDGTSANGFHRDDPNIIFASWQSANFLTNFTATPGRENWYWTAGPIFYSGERLYANEPPGSGR